MLNLIPVSYTHLYADGKYTLKPGVPDIQGIVNYPDGVKGLAADGQTAIPGICLLYTSLSNTSFTINWFTIRSLLSSIFP